MTSLTDDLFDQQIERVDSESIDEVTSSCSSTIVLKFPALDPALLSDPKTPTDHELELIDQLKAENPNCPLVDPPEEQTYAYEKYAGFERTMRLQWNSIIDPDLKTVEYFKDTIDYYCRQYCINNNKKIDLIYFYEYDGNYEDYMSMISQSLSHESAMAFIKTEYRKLTQ